MSDVTMTILQVLIIALGIVVSRYLVPFMRYKLLEIVDATLLNQIIIAVKSVEQDLQYSVGTEKKEEVMVRVTQWANAHNIKITQGQLSQLIETAVWIMKNEDKING